MASAAKASWNLPMGESSTRMRRSSSTTRFSLYSSLNTGACKQKVNLCSATPEPMQTTGPERVCRRSWMMRRSWLARTLFCWPVFQFARLLACRTCIGDQVHRQKQGNIVRLWAIDIFGMAGMQINEGSTNSFCRGCIRLHDHCSVRSDKSSRGNALLPEQTKAPAYWLA